MISLFKTKTIIIYIYIYQVLGPWPSCDFSSQYHLDVLGGFLGFQAEEELEAEVEDIADEDLQLKLRLVTGDKGFFASLVFLSGRCFFQPPCFFFSPLKGDMGPNIHVIFQVY